MINSMEFLAFQNVDLSYGSRKILGNIQLTLKRGEPVGLVGPNGSGKTTFLRALLGLLPPEKGHIQRDTHVRFAYVPQAETVHDVWPLTIEKLVSLPLLSRRPMGRLMPHEKEQLEVALRQTGLQDLRSKLFGESSGGQRQRALVAQALAQNPDVILLDEPTRGLDVLAERDLVALIQQLISRGLTVFLVSHSLQLPLNLTQRLLLFDRGRVSEATPDSILKDKRLEQIFGIPFEVQEFHGIRWAFPRRVS